MSPFLLEVLDVLLAVQAAQATVVGTVRDEWSREPIAGATVLLSDLGRSATTDAVGRYALHQVPPGPQHITVRFIGHTPHSLHALVPASGRLEINVSLRPEPVRLSTIQVRSPPPLPGAEPLDDHAFDRSLSMAAVRNHPLLAEPDAFQAFDGGDVALRAESPSGVHIRGGGSDQTAYVLDGIPIFSPYHSAGMFGAWNPDALSGVRLASSMPTPGAPDVLAGSIAASTRTPGRRLGAQGSLSTTQARLTLDGPIGSTGVGFLVSVRTGFPGVPIPQGDPSYVGLESGDQLAKLEAPILGGRLELLGYDSENEIDAAAAAEADTASQRNSFEWWSRSAGVTWRRAYRWGAIEAAGWSATAGADSRWGATADQAVLESARRDLGLLVTVELEGQSSGTVGGIRLERSRTEYRLDDWRLDASTPVVSVFGQHSRSLGRGVDATVGAGVAVGDGGAHLGPQLQIRWHPAERWKLAASYRRAHQFAQSLRDSESVVGNVFPADLFIGAAAPGIPTAHSDQGVLTVEFLPADGVRLGLEGHHRASDGLVLVAPDQGGPYAWETPIIGSGRSTGLSVQGALARARFGLTASYGVQRVRLSYQDTEYAPDHGTAHLIRAGIIVFPTATLSLRLGAAAELGRRTTAVGGGVEWEACNLLDLGCEFSGSPSHAGEALGATTLPAYLRVDVGVRKHWHFRIGQRDALVGVFGTVTNVLNRRNVLTYTRDPATGDRLPIAMRPLAPLLVGLDWAF